MNTSHQVTIFCLVYRYFGDVDRVQQDVVVFSAGEDGDHFLIRHVPYLLEVFEGDSFDAY